jgi:hypothetical protein
MKLLDDINNILNLLEPLNFKLSKLEFNDQILEYLVIKNEKISIVLEVYTFSRSYEFKICEEVEYTYDRNDIEKHLETIALDARRDPRFKYLGSRYMGENTSSDYGCIVYTKHSLHLSPSQTEPSLETIIEIIKETFKAELREIKLKQLI